MRLSDLRQSVNDNPTAAPGWAPSTGSATLQRGNQAGLHKTLPGAACSLDVFRLIEIVVGLKANC